MIAGFQAAPFWAQIAMVFFAFTALVMMTAPSLTRRKHRRHLDDIARGLGQGPSTSRDWPYVVPVNAADRAFEIRYDVRSSGRNSYRGPTGQLLITATRLAGTRWSMHQVDVKPVGKWLSKLLSGQRTTGDATFDSRFMVRQDGLPAREGWLDAPTRDAITRFFERAPKPGVIWLREGDLQFIMPQPWTDLDGPAVRRLMENQAALAAAFERTAGTIR
jgi:hypothetical protein